jgi:GNAT superfamily N-acetyltransferase
MLTQLLGVVCALAFTQQSIKLVPYSPNPQGSSVQVVMPWTPIKRQPKANEWRRIFTDVIALHEKTYPHADTNGVDDVDIELLHCPGYSDESLWFAVPLSFARSRSVDPVPYRKALIEALQDPDPKIRGQACWIAGRIFDIDLLKHIAELLDDPSPTMPIGFAFRQPNAPPSYPSPNGVRPKVQALARWAIFRMVGLGFTSKAGFDHWWAHQLNLEQKQWYWSSLWHHQWLSEIDSFLKLRQPARNKLKTDRNAHLDKRFYDLPSEQGFDILAKKESLYWGQDDARNELGLIAFQNDIAFVESWMNFESQLSFNDIAEYLKRKKLQPKMCEYLDSSKFVGGPDQRFFDTYRLFAASIAERVFKPEDDDRLKQLQGTFMTPPGISEAMATARARISPKKAYDILFEYASQNPYANNTALLLARGFGSKAGELLKGFYQRDAYRRRNIASALLSAARSRVEVKPQFLLELLNIGIPADMEEDKDDSTSILAEVVNLTLGREVVSRGYIEAARCAWLKETKEEAATRIQKRHIAENKVRTLLIEALQALHEDNTSR